jgi:hypothetical protein
MKIYQVYAYAPSQERHVAPHAVSGVYQTHEGVTKWLEMQGGLERIAQSGANLHPFIHSENTAD